MWNSANENKRSGGGRANWGNPKQAKADSDAAIEAAAAEQVTAVEGELVENVDATKTEEAPKEPEVRKMSRAHTNYILNHSNILVIV